MTNKALIYLRVSSQKQVTEGTGLESQERLCKDYAGKNNYKVIKIFREEGVSGGLFERPAMKQLIAYLDERPLEKFIVIFDDLKRFARDVKVHLELKAQLLSRGVKLECPNFNFEDSPEGRLIENVTAATAQYERESNRRQVIQKMKARMEQGYWSLRSLPSGLKYQKTKEHGKLAVNIEPYALIYKRAIEDFDKDILLDQIDVQTFINKELKQANLNDTISLSGVKSVLTELLYTGYIEYPRWGISLRKGKHKGFISLETYQSVQEKLSGKRRKTIRKDYSLDFPLRGFVNCLYCGKPMTAAWCKGRSDKYPKYWCKNKDCEFKSQTVSKNIIEDRFIELLEGVRLDSNKAELVRVILERTWEEEKENEVFTMLDQEKQRKDIDEQIKNLTLIITKTKDYDLVAEYQKQQKELILNKKQLENKVGGNKYTSEELQTASSLVFKTLGEPVRMWQSEDYQLKTTIVRMYFPNNLSYDIYNGFQTVEVEPTIKLINSFDSSDSSLVEMLGVEPRCRKNR